MESHNFSQQQIQKLESAVNKLKHAFDLERSENQKLQKQLHVLQTDHLTKLRSCGGIFAGDRREKAIQKQLHSQETKLDHLQGINSGLMADNTRLRDDTSAMKKELAALKGVLKKSDVELGGLRREVATLTQRYERTAADRDVAVSENQLMMQRFEREKEMWQSEVREMRQQLEGARRVNTLVSSATKRVSGALKAGPLSMNAGTTPTISKRTEELLVKILGDSANDINTGLLNFVNELTVEQEKLTKQVDKYSETINRLKVQASGDRNGTRRLTRMLEEKLGAAEAAAKTLQTKQAESEAGRKQVHASLTRIAETAHLFAADDEFAVERSEPTDAAILLILGLVEQHCMSDSGTTERPKESAETLTASVITKVGSMLGRTTVSAGDTEILPKRIMSGNEYRRSAREALGDLGTPLGRPG